MKGKFRRLADPDESHPADRGEPTDQRVQGKTVRQVKDALRAQDRTSTREGQR